MTPDDSRDDSFHPEEEQGDPQEVLSLENLRKAFSEALQQQEASEDAPHDGPKEEVQPEVYRFPSPEGGVAEDSPSTEDVGRDGCPPEIERSEEIEEEDLEQSEETTEEGGDTEASSSEEEGFGDEAVEVSPRTILESMLFVGHPKNEPLEPSRAASLMRNVAPEEICSLIDELNEEYDQSSAPYTIVATGGGYRMVLRDAFESIRARFYGKVRESRLSQAAIDVLAVVAYRQPITSEEVQKIRGTDSGSVLSQLVRRELLSVERQIREKRRVKLYRTTDRFLTLFELDSLDDLPTTEEIDYR